MKFFAVFFEVFYRRKKYCNFKNHIYLYRQNVQVKNINTIHLKNENH